MKNASLIWRPNFPRIVDHSMVRIQQDLIVVSTNHLFC